MDLLIFQLETKKYFYQSNDAGLTKEEKKNYKIFLQEYEEYKNLYNLRNRQNISEIRDVINKYGENAKIHLGGIPMIADDMMSFIKRINWVWIGLILLNGLIWWSIFTNGFFTTLLWLIIGSSIIGIILKLKEDTRV